MSLSRIGQPKIISISRSALGTNVTTSTRNDLRVLFLSSVASCYASNILLHTIVVVPHRKSHHLLEREKMKDYYPFATKI